ncbi:MAG: competence protein ComEC, partial [Pseudomonadota bacterium]
MAGSAFSAPSTHLPALQIGVLRGVAAVNAGLEQWLEAERDQLALWVPVALGAGIALWFVLPDPVAWRAAGCLALAVALGGVAF